MGPNEARSLRHEPPRWSKLTVEAA